MPLIYDILIARWTNHSGEIMNIISFFFFDFFCKINLKFSLSLIFNRKASISINCWSMQMKMRRFNKYIYIILDRVLNIIADNSILHVLMIFAYCNMCAFSMHTCQSGFQFSVRCFLSVRLLYRLLYARAKHIPTEMPDKFLDLWPA